MLRKLSIQLLLLLTAQPFLLTDAAPRATAAQAPKAPVTTAPAARTGPAAPTAATAPANAGESPSSAANALPTAEQEMAFAELMSGATLEGNFTSRDHQEGKIPRPEKYTLGKVSKLKGDLWQFETRIQYGKTDVTVPLALRVVWSGDTPVITLDRMVVPGIGTFTCRVMIFDRQYAGMWDGGNNHGGLLFGKITPAADKPAGNAPASEVVPTDKRNAIKSAPDTDSKK